MVGYGIENGFIDFGKTEFKCPHCNKKYDDEDDKYLDRINKNKNWCTKIKCKCDKTFELTFDSTGDFITFVK